MGMISETPHSSHTTGNLVALSLNFVPIDALGRKLRQWYYDRNPPASEMAWISTSAQTANGMPRMKNGEQHGMQHKIAATIAHVFEL